jgi:uncharacterized membrane protein
MTINIIPLIVCIVGLLLFAFAPQAKAQTVGDRMFFAGMLAWLMSSGAHGISIH